MTAVAPLAQTEAEFQAAVIQLAQVTGHEVMHVRRSVVREGRWATATSIAGWPDLVIIGHRRVIYAELKSEHGRLSADQRRFLIQLRACGQDVRVWRPSDWESIVAELSEGRARG